MHSGIDMFDLLHDVHERKSTYPLKVKQLLGEGTFNDDHLLLMCRN